MNHLFWRHFHSFDFPFSVISGFPQGYGPPSAGGRPFPPSLGGMGPGPNSASPGPNGDMYQTAGPGHPHAADGSVVPVYNNVAAAAAAAAGSPQPASLAALTARVSSLCKFVCKFHANITISIISIVNRLDQWLTRQSFIHSTISKRKCRSKRDL